MQYKLSILVGGVFLGAATLNGVRAVALWGWGREARLAELLFMVALSTLCMCVVIAADAADAKEEDEIPPLMRPDESDPVK